MGWHICMFIVFHLTKYICTIIPIDCCYCNAKCLNTVIPFVLIIRTYTVCNKKYTATHLCNFINKMNDSISCFAVTTWYIICCCVIWHHRFNHVPNKLIIKNAHGENNVNSQQKLKSEFYSSIVLLKAENINVQINNKHVSKFKDHPASLL